MNRSNRQSAYEWINKWLDKESEGKAEAEVLQAETMEELWCTKSGHTLVTPGGETGQTLNAKRADQIYKPEKDLAKLRQRIARRIKLNLPRNYEVPRVQSVETVSHEGISIEKMTYQSEEGILVPTLLITPESLKPDSPVYVHLSDKGKPRRIEKSLTPFLLAENGCIVLALDVRGMGETSPTPSLVCDRFTGYTPLKFRHDTLAIEITGFGRTTLGMRTLDVIRGVDFLTSLDDLEGRRIVLVGEGLGGLWALLAAVYDPRASGVVTIGTLPSYRLLVKSKYYSQWGYFWTPGVLCDFDILDLARLISPRPQVWVDPVNALGERIDFASASSLIGSHENLQVLTGDQRDPTEMLHLLDRLF
jgi:pimeloyl-ACP methyl ester carboxylesterase